MAKTDTVTMRIDRDLKKQAEALCNDMGLTLSAAYTIFLKAIVRTKSIPFIIQAQGISNELDDGSGLSSS